MKVIETRYIDTSKIRTMCIKNDFYTRGTIEEYCMMFDKCNNVDIIETAKDIFEHSDKEELLETHGCSEMSMLEHICYMIINDCSYTFVSIED